MTRGVGRAGSIVVAAIAALTAVGAAGGGRASEELRRREVIVRGDVRAELGYSLQGKLAAGTRTTTAFHLRVIRAGELLVNQSLLTTDDGLDLTPKGLGAKPSLLLTDLDGDGEREVIVNTVTCPGHCYFFTFIYRYLRQRSEYERTSTLCTRGDPRRVRRASGGGPLRLGPIGDGTAWGLLDVVESGAVFPADRGQQLERLRSGWFW